MDNMNLFKNNEIPSEELLKKLSFRSSYGKSLNKLSLSEDLLKIVIDDLPVYHSKILLCDEITFYTSRIKSKDSCIKKYYKGLNKSLRFNSTSNDLFGFRLKVDEYSQDYPDYYRIVDLRNGKRENDGYRAIHLYYQLDNFHYQIEVQLWGSDDYNFNHWSHLYGYKYQSSEVLRQVRIEYDQGYIRNESEFIERMNYYGTR